MNKFSIEEAFNRAWGLFKSHKKVLILATLISLMADMLTDKVQGDEWSVLFFIIWVAFYIISLWIWIGFFKITLHIIDGHSAKLNELFAYSKLIKNYLLAVIAYGLVVALGLILLIIPGIYFAFKYLFAPLLVIDKGLTVGEAFKESAHMTLGIKWKLMGLGLVACLINLLGILALGIGLLVSIPVTQLMVVYVYRKLLVQEVSTAQA